MTRRTIGSTLAWNQVISVCALLVVVVASGAFIFEDSRQDRGRLTVSELDAGLRKLDAEMLQARRNEKDFILRRDEKYVTRHAETITRIDTLLETIRVQAAMLDLPDSDRLLTEIYDTLHRYETGFGRLVDLTMQLGLTPDEGLEGAQRAAVHEIETLLEGIGNDALTVKMLMMRRHEKDFIMRTDEKYVDRLNARVEEFQAFPVSAFGSPRTRDEANQLLRQYQSAFITLAETTLAERATRQDLSRLYAEITPYVDEFRVAADNLFAYKSTRAAETRALFLWGLAAAVAVSLLAFLYFTRRTSIAIGQPLVAYANALSDLAEGRESAPPPDSKIAEIQRISTALATLRENESDRQALQSRAEASQRAREQVTETLQDGLRRLADGDLVWRIDSELDPQFEALRTDYNRAVDHLQKVMTDIVISASDIRSGAQQMAGSASDLSRRTESQAASLEETAAALEQLSTSVRDSSMRAEEANEIVSGAQRMAEESGDVVRDTVTAMGQIEDSSKKISQIIGVIDDIAFQTNLLALNAGVEAARAGDAGRGFAVVASEVRGLAQRSSDAAREIKALISTSAVHVERGVEFVDKTGTKLTGIADMVTRISDLVSEITASSKEQSGGLTEISTAMAGLDEVTQRNTAMVGETTQESQNLTRHADSLEQITQRFRIDAGIEAVPMDPLARAS